MTVRNLPSDIKVTGVDQQSLVNFLQNVQDLVNELRADHATFKTVVTDNKALANLLQHRSQNFVVSTSPALAIDTNFDVKNIGTTLFVAGGVSYTLGGNTSCDTGTTKTITGTKWGAFAVEASSASALSANWAGGAAVLSAYDSEALALAAAKALAPTADKCVIGYVTVQAHASGFTAGTDALTTGTGGNVATTTNYYDLSVPSFAAVSTSAPDTLAYSSDLTLLKT